MDASLVGVKKAEQCFRKKHGETIWVETTTVAVKSRGKVKYYLSNWVDVTEQRQHRENLEFYITEVTRAQEEERKRVARELHDSTIQALSCLYIDIENVIAREGGLSDRAIRGLREIGAKIDGAIEEARRFSHELRPALLDRFGLIPSLELLVKEFRECGGLDCSLEITGSERRLSPEAELALFRIAQEALHNVKKHAAASRAAIGLRFTGTTVELSVSDNGRGFKLPTPLSDFARVSKLGVTGMNERAHLLGGSMSIESGSGRGTTIIVQVPA
jgi:signal transduction histidine kinase